MQHDENFDGIMFANAFSSDAHFFIIFAEKKLHVSIWSKWISTCSMTDRQTSIYTIVGGKEEITMKKNGIPNNE